jgi:hypothetical protein
MAWVAAAGCVLRGSPLRGEHLILRGPAFQAGHLRMKEIFTCKTRLHPEVLAKRASKDALRVSVSR